MGRAPCCDKTKVKKGPWSPEEDTTLRNYIEKYGTGGNWIALPHKAGLKRCGKSCRLRWLNYLRPDIKHGGFTDEENNIILTLYTKMGSRWSIIASHLPGRTDNDVKNYWNTKLKKKLLAAEAKGLKEVGNPSNPTSIMPINSSNSNSLTTNSSDFSIATSFNELQTNFYGNSSIYPSTSSESLMQYSSTDHLIQGYPAGVVLDMPYESTSTDQFPLPGLLEIQENGKPQNGFTASYSQEISSLSPSYSFAKSYASWNDNVVTDEVGFFMELESKLSNFDLLQNAPADEAGAGFFVELESKLSNFDLLQNAPTDEAGFFAELESKLSNFDPPQNARQEVNVSTQVDGCSLLNYSDPSFLANISDDIVPC